MPDPITPDEGLATRDTRTEPRDTPFHIHEVVEIGGAKGWLLDLTPIGARLELTRAPEKEEEIRIWIELPEQLAGSSPRLRVLGRVKWVKIGKRQGIFEVGMLFDQRLDLPDKMFWSS